MTVRVLLLVIALTLSAPVVADDSPVYESFRGVKIGRVFLSQERRNLLDKRRLQVPRRRADAGAPSAAGPQKKAAPAAGYIIGPGGRSKTWRNGDFVETASDPAQRMRFPGDVAVRRHPAPAKSTDDGGAD